MSPLGCILLPLLNLPILSVLYANGIRRPTGVTSFEDRLRILYTSTVSIVS